MAVFFLFISIITINSVPKTYSLMKDTFVQLFFVATCLFYYACNRNHYGFFMDSILSADKNKSKIDCFISSTFRWFYTYRLFIKSNLYAASKLNTVYLICQIIHSYIRNTITILMNVFLV